LLQLLNSPNLDNFVSAVAESLENIGQGNQNAIDALVQCSFLPILMITPVGKWQKA
jgi:hypothetical protein